MPTWRGRLKVSQWAPLILSKRNDSQMAHVLPYLPNWHFAGSFPYFTQLGALPINIKHCHTSMIQHFRTFRKALAEGDSSLCAPDEQEFLSWAPASELQWRKGLVWYVPPPSGGKLHCQGFLSCIQFVSSHVWNISTKEKSVILWKKWIAFI